MELVGNRGIPDTNYGFYTGNEVVKGFGRFSVVQPWTRRIQREVWQAVSGVCLSTSSRHLHPGT